MALRPRDRQCRHGPRGQEGLWLTAPQDRPKKRRGNSGRAYQQKSFGNCLLDLYFKRAWRSNPLKTTPPASKLDEKLIILSQHSAIDGVAEVD